MGIVYSFFWGYFGKPESLETSSEEEFDYTCDVCDYEYQKEAEYFCKECGQYLCQTCFKNHKKINSTKNHSFLGKTSFSTLKKANEDAALFKMKVTPLKLISNVNGKTECMDIYGLHSLPESGKTYVLLYDDDDDDRLIEVGYLSSSKGYRMVRAIKKSKMDKHDLDDLDDAFIYFVLPGKRRIFIYDVDEKTVEMAFLTSSPCYSITKFNNGLATLVHIDGWHIQFLSYSGRLKKQVCYDQNGQRLFKEPKQIVSNDKETTVYVSDRGNKAVIALDTDGNLLFKFTDDELSLAKGLTCSSDGNIYVACGKNIIQIEKRGQKCKKLFSKDSDIDYIYYNNHTKKMFTSAWEEVTIYTCSQ